MHQVYLLLRNNRQTGPFTLNELVESGLKPHDLVWIEGKSTSWSYPSEIIELQSYFIEHSQAPGNDQHKSSGIVVEAAHQAYLPKEVESPKIVQTRKVFVSLPENGRRQPGASANGRRQPAGGEAANGKRQTAEEEKPVQQTPAPDPIALRAEELRNKLLEQSWEAANGRPQTAEEEKPVQQTPAPDSIALRAEELRNKIMAQSAEAANGSRQTAEGEKSVQNTPAPDPIALRAEELRNKIMAQSAEAANGSRQTAVGEKSVQQTPAPDPIALRAEELRNKILAQSANGSRQPAVGEKPVQNTTAPDPIALRAEELRNKILAQSGVAENGSRQTADGETPSTGATATDSIEAKAEELRKKILAQSREMAIGKQPAEELTKRTEVVQEKLPRQNNGKKEPAINYASISRSIKDITGTWRKKIAAFSTAQNPEQVSHSSIGPDRSGSVVQTGSFQAKSIRKLKEAEAGFTSWIHNQKAPTKKDILKRSPAIIGIALLLIAGGYLTSRFGSEKPVVASENSIEQVPFEDVEGGSLMEQTQESPAEVPADANISSTYPHPSEPTSSQSTEKKKEEPVLKPAPETKANSQQIKAEEKKATEKVPVENKPVEKKVAETKTPEKKAVVVAAAPEKEIKVEPVVQGKKAEPVASTTQEKKEVPQAPVKKKTFTDKIDGFFGKLNKRIAPDPEEQVNGEQAKSTTVDNAERKAARRGEEEATPRTVNLNEYVDVRTTEASGDWMLGVHGLKLVVHNRSAETVHQAAVEVRYYNEHQELIEKKLINVSNVPPKKTVTVTAPDHRLADHAEVVLVSAK